MAAKTTFSLQEVVYVAIRGEGPEGPHVLKDDGLVARFQAWLNEKRILPAIRGGSSGAGRFHGFFYAEDAPRIRAWLSQQGATEKEE